MLKAAGMVTRVVGQLRTVHVADVLGETVLADCVLCLELNVSEMTFSILTLMCRGLSEFRLFALGNE